MGRIIESSIYALLKRIAAVLGETVSYDTGKKVPPFDGKPVTQFRVIGLTTYFKLADLRTLVGAKLTWDKNAKILFINTQRQS